MNFFMAMDLCITCNIFYMSNEMALFLAGYTSIFAFLSNWFISDFLLDFWKSLCIHNTNLSWSEKATRYSTRRTSRKRPISAFFLQVKSKYLWQGLTRIARQRSQSGCLNWRQPSKLYSSQSDSSELFFFLQAVNEIRLYTLLQKKKYHWHYM